MKVKELVAMLQQYDGEKEVLVRGYEYGYQSPDPEAPVKMMDLHKESDEPGIGGNYDEHSDGYCFKCDEGMSRASYVVIDR